MQYGLSLPPFGNFADPHVLMDAARRAEAAGWDGYAPIKQGGLLPEDCRAILASVKQQRTLTTPFDLVGGSDLPSDPAQARDRLHEYIDAGLTWWLEGVDPWRDGANWEAQWQPEYTRKMINRIEQGPPRR